MSDKLIDTRDAESNYLSRDNIVPSNASPPHVKARILHVAKWDKHKRSTNPDVDEVMNTLAPADVVKALNDPERR